MNAGVCAGECTLVSRRPDVARVFSRFFNPIRQSSANPVFFDGIERFSTPVLLDISSINNFSSSNFLDKISLIQGSTLFILPLDTPYSYRKLIYERASYYVDFPAENFTLERTVKEFSKFSTTLRKKAIHNEFERLILYNPHFDSLLGNSYLMQKVRAKILSYAGGKEPVLLLGESGTGKTTAAHLIHKLSHRKKLKFNQLNVSTVAVNLADSTFFGQEEGSYTGARKTSGIIAETDNGTLFMDEIGTAALAIQSKLLSFLDSGLYSPVGSSLLKKSDVRMIFATNENLIEKIERKEFRKDFYFRIAQNVIDFPPLKDRLEDIDEIAPTIARKKGKLLSENAILKLKEYSWPGNIRQLTSCINQAANLSYGKVIESDSLEFNF